MEHVSEVSTSTDCTELSITAVPEVKDSLSSSLAYIFFGPFETVTLLTRAGSHLRQQVLKYIRGHRHIFFKHLSNYYNKVFPNHGLDPQMVFEHCCVYLAHPEHTAVYEILFAVATLFNTPIVVIHEDGRQSQKVSPSQPSCAPAVNILSRKNNTFAPVDKVLSAGNSQVMQRVFPLSSNSSKPSLLVATWHIQKSSKDSGCEELDNRLIMDECLALRRVDVACLQGVGLNSGKVGKFNATPHYDWYGTGASPQQQSVVILVRKNSGAVLNNFLPISNNLVTANILFYSVTYSVIGTILPTSSNKFHSECIYSLESAITQVPTLSQILILGDFNACIGILDIRKPHKEFIGNNLLHKECNLNGSILLKWSKTHKLRIVTTFPCETPDSKATWRAGSELFQVSHILTQLQPYKKMRNFLWWESCSDHAIVSCNIESCSSLSDESTNNSQFMVATWNVINSATDTLRYDIDRALMRHNIDLACLQGSHSADIQLSTENYDWWCTGVKKSVNAYGICFLLRKNSRASLTNVVGHTNRLASAILSIDGYEVVILGCELPESKSPITQQVYCDILQVASKAPPSSKLLILGMFNAIIGKDLLYYQNLSERQLICESGIGKGDHSNKNGRRLMNLAILYDLYICSTFIKEPIAQFSHILFVDEELTHIWNCNVSKFPIMAINISA